MSALDFVEKFSVGGRWQNVMGSSLTGTVFLQAG